MLVIPGESNISEAKPGGKESISRLCRYIVPFHIIITRFPLSPKATLYTYLFDIYLVQITLIAISLNLIFKGYLSRKSTPTIHNLITLFGVDSLLIELDKFFIFLHVTNLSMMFRLVKNVITYICYVAF